MWTVSHWLLVSAYFVAPVGLVVWAAWSHQSRSRNITSEEESDEPSSPKAKRGGSPWMACVLTIAAGTLVGTGLVLTYARMTTGQLADAPIWEIVKASWFTTALLVLLKVADLAVSGLLGRVTRKLARGGNLQRGSGRALTLFGRLAFLLAAGLPFFMAAAMTYRPKVVSNETPLSLVRLPFEEANFTAADGTKLHGWWIAAGDAQSKLRSPLRSTRKDATVVLVHGLGGGKFDVLPSATVFEAAGYDVLLFDLRAHGASGGNLTSFGDAERLDVAAAAKWAREKAPDQPVLGVALSMGGAAAVSAREADGDPVFDALAIIDSFGRWSALADDLVDRQFSGPVGVIAEWVAIPAAMAHAGRDLRSFAP
ncbi:MAG: alpha/beta fold hydrolase, partial [Planctomycetota bacterium]